MSSHAEPAVSSATKEESPPPSSLPDRPPSENEPENEPENEMSARAASASKSGDSDTDVSDYRSSEQRIRELNHELQALNKKVAAMQGGMRRVRSRGRDRDRRRRRRSSSSSSSDISPQVPVIRVRTRARAPSPIPSPVRRARTFSKGSKEAYDDAREREAYDDVRERWELERAKKELDVLRQREAEDRIRREMELQRLQEEQAYIRKSGKEGFASMSRDSRVERKVNESKRRGQLIHLHEQKKLDDKAEQAALVRRQLRVQTTEIVVDEPNLEETQRPLHGPRNMVPVKSHMEWSAFRMANNSPGPQVNLHDLPTLDILVEEPALLTEPETSTAHRPQDSTQGASDTAEKSEAYTVLSQTAPGYNAAERPLPERIRVQSPIILQFLAALLPDFPQRSLNPRVLVRPYRALAHYYSTIRDEWCFWAADFEIASSRRRQTDDKSRNILRATRKRWSPDEMLHGPEDVMAYRTFGRRTPEQALRHVECLIEFMDDFLKKKIDGLTSPDCHKVFFVDIWHIFKPGDFVINRDGRQVYQILSITSTGHKAAVSWNDYSSITASKTMSPGTEMPIRILCVHIDYDGVQLGPVPTEFVIKKYEGEKAIESLEIRPAHLNRDSSQRERFVARGRRFLQAASIQHLHYAGFTLETRDEVDSQVVVDFAETFAAPGISDWKPVIEPQIGTAAFMPNFETCEAACCKDDFIFYDDYVEQVRDDAFMKTLVPPKWEHSKLPSVAVYPRTLEEAKTPGNSLTDDELLIMSYRVFGFVLSSRKWAKLDLECLKPVGSGNARNEDESVSENVGAVDHDTEASFDQLVLPKGHKEMVLSLVAQHFRNKETAGTVRDQFDIVRGKGKGLIILLHGAPGVGKTSTAECVAELFGKPLFQITCGDLGTTAKEVESSLETNFALANKWGCILLIDEADVFLARRTTSDFSRNGLVAVFLRVLEYYAGILFLTTNRIGDFDEAFTSRIHISLHYPPLDDESTEAVFQVNLKRILKRFRDKGRIINIEEVKICVFARIYWQEHFKARWNGRQIRNACQTALALSEFESQGGMSVFEGQGAYRAALEAKPDIAVHLKVDHFKTVANAYLSFIGYLDEIYGVDADTRAKENFLRASNTGYPIRMEPMNPLLGSSRWKEKAAWNYQTGPALPAAGPQGPQQHHQKPGYSPYGQPGVLAPQGREESNQRNIGAVNLSSLQGGSGGSQSYYPMPQQGGAYQPSAHPPPGVPVATTGRGNIPTAQRPTQPWNPDSVDAYQNQSAYLASHQHMQEQQPWQHVPQGHGSGFSPNTQAGGGSLGGEALLRPAENFGNLR